MALATLGEPEDMADLERLINADIERSAGAVARVRGSAASRPTGLP